MREKNKNHQCPNTKKKSSIRPSNYPRIIDEGLHPTTETKHQQKNARENTFFLSLQSDKVYYLKLLKYWSKLVVQIYKLEL